MSWKKFVTAGLLCVLASPVLAAPTLTVTGSRLTKEAVPERVWNIAVAQDTTLSGGSSPIGLELGFVATGGNITSISSAQNATRVDNLTNPGNVIFGGETLTDVDPGAGTNNKPVGLQLGSGWTAPAPTRAFAAIGTVVFTTGAKQDLITITTDASVTSLAWGGAYTSGSPSNSSPLAPNGSLQAVGRIAQATGVSTSANYHEASYAGSLAAGAAGPTRSLADMNGDGNVNFGDLAGFGQAISAPVTYTANFPHLNRVGRGDINGDGNFNFGDLAGFGQILQGNNPGSGSGAAVPEPASVALIGLALMGGLGIVRRRR